MEFQSRYMFHRDFGARRFDSAEDIEAAGDGWKCTPAEADEYPVLKAQREAEDERIRQEAGKPVEPVKIVVEPAILVLPEPSDEQKIADVLGVKVEDLHKLELTPADAAELLSGVPAGSPQQVGAGQTGESIRVTVSEG